MERGGRHAQTDLLSAMSLGLLIGLTPFAHADLALRMANAIKAAVVRNQLRTEAELPCVTLVPEEETAAYIEIAVREKHGRGWPDDPGTEPCLFNVRHEKRSSAVLKERDTMNGWDRLR